jgi:hypothetical protein
MKLNLTVIKQIQVFTSFHEKLLDIKKKLIHSYIKTNNIEFLQGYVNLEEFETCISKDFLVYSKDTQNKNIDEFKVSIDILDAHLKKFCEAYNLK